MRLSIGGLVVSVNGWWLAVSCERFEVVVRWRSVFRRWEFKAFTDSGTANGVAWRTADVWAGPFEVTRFV